MDSQEFRKRGKEMVDRIVDYMSNVNKTDVISSASPGEVRGLLPSQAPAEGESFDNIMADFERIIIPGITHWQHNRFHGFYPTGNSYPSTLADMLSDGLGCLAFSWAASPSCTELEMAMTDWFGKMIGLPEVFLHESGQGGGVIQGSATECLLINLLAARHRVLQSLKKSDNHNHESDVVNLSKLIGYASTLVNSSFDKSAMIAMVQIRKLPVDKELSLRGETLKDAIESDYKKSLIPFFVCVTLGSTSCCSFDNLKEIADICHQYDIWLHVDAAYAGNAFILQEFRHYLNGIENAFSINVNPCKMLLVHSDTSLMWVKDRNLLTSAMTVNPLYLQHKNQGSTIDFMFCKIASCFTYSRFYVLHFGTFSLAYFLWTFRKNWGLTTSRRFRALKLWFVLRTYGVDGLQRHVKKIISLRKIFEERVNQNSNVEIVGKPALGLVCFRLKGSNAMTETLLNMINDSRKLFMIPAMVQDKYVIRFVVCSQNADVSDIDFAWKHIEDNICKLNIVPERLEMK